MKSKQRSLVRLGTALLASLISISLHAQDAGAALSGTVTDAAGKPIAGVRITIKKVATGQSTEIQADFSGTYVASNMTPGDYEVSIAAPGFTTAVTPVSIGTSVRQTLNLTLRGLLSLEDLGFPLVQAQGNAADQALLDRRSHMLKLHQRYGLIAVVPLVAAVVAGGSASGKESSAGSRNLHAALSISAAGLYSISAYYAIAAPKIPGIVESRGNIRWHKALAWVHGAGMILTPALGEIAYEQRRRGEKVHGIASAHGAVAVTTVAAYGAAILTEVLK